jgi:hypothetical protein
MSGTPYEWLSALASRFGVAKPELLVLDASNDPYNSGSPNDVKLAGWFTSLYEALGSPRVHLRDLHYLVVVRLLRWPDGRIYEGTAKDWRELLKASKKARDLGLVSPWAFIDRRTQAQHLYDEARAHPAQPAWVDPGFAYLSRPRLEVPEWELFPPTLEGVPTALSLQPVLLELWIEKDSAALNAEVLPVAEWFGCRVVVGAGFQSKTAAAELVARTIEDGRERVVLWLADADSLGESMAIATARHTEFLCRHWLAEHEPETVVPRIVMDRVALTLEQVAEIGREIGRTIPVSPDVDREAGRVELQALAAFAPGWVGAELERRLTELTDMELDDEIDAWKDEAEEAIEDAWDAETAASVERLITLREKRDAILERFDVAALNAALDEIEVERRALHHEVDEIVLEFNPVLPEQPSGWVDVDEDARDWLLNTEREYVEQLNAYRRHEPSHRHRPPLELIEPTCACGCGKPVAGRRRWASEACRKRRERSAE